MTEENTEAPPGANADPPDRAGSLAQYRRILAEAELLAELFDTGSYPLLAKHTSGGLRATLAVHATCAIRLTDVIRDHTAAMREQTEAQRKRKM